MDQKEELRVLQEIESSIEPEFGVFPYHTKYDKDFKVVECCRFYKTGDQFVYPNIESREDPTYVELHDTDSQNYLIPLVSHLIYQDKIFFNLEELFEFGQNKPGPKFCLL